MANAIVVALTILAWYGSNIGVIILNKMLITGSGFDAPVLLTLCHMTSCALLSALIGCTDLWPIKRIGSLRQLGKV